MGLNPEEIVFATVAGAEGIAVEVDAVDIYASGVIDVLDGKGKLVTREVVHATSTSALRGFKPKLLEQSKDGRAPEVPATLHAFRGAAIAAGRAAGVGAAVDGVVAMGRVAGPWWRGDISERDAALYVAKEAATGGMAAGAGVALTALVVAVTGPVGGPVAFVIAAGGATAAKSLLKAVA